MEFAVLSRQFHLLRSFLEVPASEASLLLRQMPYMPQNNTFGKCLGGDTAPPSMPTSPASRSRHARSTRRPHTMI